MTLKSSLFSISIFGLSLLATPAKSQNVGQHTIWNADYLNQLTNIRYGALNPTRLSFNTEKTSGLAVLDYTLTRGNYHKLDESGRQNDLNFMLAGLKNIGKLDLSGYLKYINTQADNKVWNSTLYLSPENPFIIGDSILSDQTTESFDMNAAASYQINEQWKGALSIGLLVGSLSDQNDPRPKTNTSRLPITAGVEWQMHENWSLGLAGNVEFFRSDISHTVINNYINYRIILMKGMGDSYAISTSTESGYKREYHGTTFKGALQSVYAPKNSAWSDFVEISVKGSTEIAEDGGSSYTFKGGDFKQTNFAIQNRTIYKPCENVMHNLTVKANFSKGTGTWYDQKKVTDTEHANRVDYVVLNENDVHKQTLIGANAEYRLDLLKDNQPDFYAAGNVGLDRTTTKHLTDDGTVKQEYSIAHINLGAGKNFLIGNKKLNVSVGGGYYLPIGDKTFATGCQTGTTTDITGSYVIPMFEYATSKHFNIAGIVDFKTPVKIQGADLALGIFAKAGTSIYSDNNEYSDRYKSSALTNINFGVYLDF